MPNLDGVLLYRWAHEQANQPSSQTGLVKILFQLNKGCATERRIYHAPSILPEIWSLSAIQAPVGNRYLPIWCVHVKCGHATRAQIPKLDPQDRKNGGVEYLSSIAVLDDQHIFKSYLPHCFFFSHPLLMNNGGLLTRSLHTSGWLKKSHKSNAVSFLHYIDLIDFQFPCFCNHEDTGSLSFSHTQTRSGRLNPQLAIFVKSKEADIAGSTVTAEDIPDFCACSLNVDDGSRIGQHEIHCITSFFLCRIGISDWLTKVMRPHFQWAYLNSSNQLQINCAVRFICTLSPSQ